uniref:BAR/IMD domain containing adaptor protein 2 like 2 n=1 Tax=Saimiri boliviensis boliviensis TaxID=39432 RepID=A0A2K6SP91_SAIBB
MAPEMDQCYRSTIAIYKSIMEQFNPALENLVYLGNNYLRAFHALSEAAEVYFSAIQKIGEHALQSPTSQILGEILVQMSDTQRHLNSDLEVVVQTFHGDLLQHMEKNTKLDMQFIKDSRQHYEIEYRHRAANLEKCMSELWRMERKRDKNVREMKESVNRLHAQMQAFVSESQRAAELEEKRRYRFLAEKHLLLSNTFLHFFGRVSCTGGPQVVCLPQPPKVSPGAHGWIQRPRLQLRLPSARSYHLTQPQAQIKHTELIIVSQFQAKSLPVTLREECFLLVIVPGPGLKDPLSLTHRSGWFPEAYVKALEEGPMNPMSAMTPMTSMTPMMPMKPMNPVNELPSRSYPLRGSHSLDDLLDRPGNSTAPSDRVPSRAPSPVPPPLPSSRRSSMGSTGVATDVKKLMSSEQYPPQELFPRGTNPFATVKLRPTITNDRSAPLIR